MVSLVARNKMCLIEIEDCLFGCAIEGDGSGQLLIAASIPSMGGSNGGLDSLQDILHIIGIGQGFTFCYAWRARGHSIFLLLLLK